MTAPIRLGVLGGADIAWRRMLPSVAAEPGMRLVAVASRRPERAQEFARRFDCEPVVGYQKLLDRGDIDAVYLPLPSGLHHRWALAALLAGKHVLTEKPMATTAAQVGELFEQAANSGLVLMENDAFTRHSVNLAVTAMIGAGEIGEVRAVHSAFAIPARPADDIRYQPELGGGALLDVGFYPLRAASMLLGDGLSLVGATATYGPTGVDLSGAVLLRDAHGVGAHLTFGFDHAYRADYEVTGSTGRLLLRRPFTQPPDHRPTVLIERDSGTTTLTLEADDQFVVLLRAFERAVRTGDALRAHRAQVIERARLVDAIRATTAVVGVA